MGHSPKTQHYEKPDPRTACEPLLGGAGRVTNASGGGEREGDSVMTPLSLPLSLPLFLSLFPTLPSLPLSLSLSLSLTHTHTQRQRHLLHMPGGNKKVLRVNLELHRSSQLFPLLGRLCLKVRPRVCTHTHTRSRARSLSLSHTLSLSLSLSHTQRL